MSLYTIKVPDKYKHLRVKLRVEALPTNNTVFKGIIRHSAPMDLDMGKYVWAMWYYDSTKRNNFKHRGEFFHGISEEDWGNIEYMKPMIAKTMFTTTGKWYRCEFVGCTHETQSRVYAVLHEAEHQGVDLLTHPEKKEEVDKKLGEYAEEKRGKKRGPGRPRKSEPREVV